MVIVGDKILSDDLFDEQFVCNLNACKGACCWEGDYGAPLSTDEVDTLKRIYEDVKPFLTPEGIAVIERSGGAVYIDEEHTFATDLINNAACAYMTRDAEGKAACGIEQAWKAGKTDFQKPISCHLYPIRITELPDYEALNYDRWDICKAACDLGKSLQMPVYKFLKDALIRKYGPDFYEEVEATAAYLQSQKGG